MNHLSRDVEKLPEGVLLKVLHEHSDTRGRLMEIYRTSEGLPPFPQMNYVRSKPGVLRGVHVHPDHADYLMVLDGTMILGVHDIRRTSPTFGVSCLITLDAAKPMTCFIPTGVAHGFYLPCETTYLYGLSGEWSLDGDFGCHWNDAALGIDWPLEQEPTVSDRDRDAMSFDEMVERYESIMAQRDGS
ncbi:MAG: dTDP-4-dehydrorhamnose 3,5-epimerase [Pseudomonadota bacterium]